jgi:hypothetical protein
MNRNKLCIVTGTHRAVVYDGPLPRETAAEIAARIRAGKPPVRHLVYRETIDGVGHHVSR